MNVSELDYQLLEEILGGYSLVKQGVREPLELKHLSRGRKKKK